MREKQQAAEQRKIERMADSEDRIVRISQHELESKISNFRNTVFLTDHIWDRREKRQEIFAIFDNFWVVNKAYWTRKNKKDLELTIGKIIQNSLYFLPISTIVSPVLYV